MRGAAAARPGRARARASAQSGPSTEGTETSARPRSLLAPRRERAYGKFRARERLLGLRLRGGRAHRPRLLLGGRRPPGRPWPPTQSSESRSSVACTQRIPALQTFEKGRARETPLASRFLSIYGSACEAAQPARPPKTAKGFCG